MTEIDPQRRTEIITAAAAQIAARIISDAVDNGVIDTYAEAVGLYDDLPSDSSINEALENTLYDIMDDLTREGNDI